MATHHLRNDTTCQNCNAAVTTRFCTHCGQENTETRQSFGHLIRHFAEDLTHYDGNFWRTIKYLLFKPAFLTREFLSGRRNSYVPPVRLYIFISFITFLLPYLLPDFSEVHEPVVAAHKPADNTAKQQSASILLSREDDHWTITVPNHYTSVRQLDSIQNTLPAKERMGWLEYWQAKKYIHLQKYTGAQLGERFMESFKHNFPKALFVYLPLFAGALWLFNSKRRWLYFDHAIFTLHYFSFLLLVFNLLILCNAFFPINNEFYHEYLPYVILLVMLSDFVYFLVAYKRMYQQPWFISLFKLGFLFLTNVFLFFLVFIGLGIVSVYMIH